MATALKLTTVRKTPTTAPSKKKREQIDCIELPPSPDWFVRTRERGRNVFYLRLRMTGMFPRRFGPFASRNKALLALDNMIGASSDAFSNWDEEAKKYLLNRRYQHTWGPVIEDDLALPKGR